MGAAPGKTVVIAITTALAISVAGNIYQFMAASDLKTKNQELETASSFYKSKYKDGYLKRADHLNDLLALWISTLKKVDSAEMRGNRKETLDAVDNANAVSGAMTSHVSVDGFISSSVMSDRFSAGRISDRVLKSDMDQTADWIEKGKGKAQRKIAYYKKMADLKPGQPEPELPK